MYFCTMSETRPIIFCSDRREWREWLAENHDTAKEIWFVFPTNEAHEESVSYNDAVEEALCFGWIDGVAGTLDSTHMLRRFTPRRKGSSYSRPNIERLIWLEKQGLIHPSVRSAVIDIINEPFIYPGDIIEALQADETVWKNYQAFSEPYKRIRTAYIDAARKRPEEFRRRLRNFIDKTRHNKLIVGYGGIDKYYRYMDEVIIRKAVREEARQIAELIMMAWPVEQILETNGIAYQELLEAIRSVVEMPETIYSYENTFVAEADGIVVGAMCGYDGADYQRFKQPVVDMLGNDSGFAELLETEAGEFYLDSVGVMAGYRGRGIASSLFKAQIARAASMGHSKVGLIVDEDKPQAEALYNRLGFNYVDDKDFFGHRMKHLVYKING